MKPMELMTNKTTHDYIQHVWIIRSK